MLARIFLRRESSATKTKLRVRRPLHHGSLATRAPVVPLPRFAGAERASVLATRSASEFDQWRGANAADLLRYPPLATCFFLPSSKEGRQNADRRRSNRRAYRARRALSGARTPVGVPPRLSPKGVSHPKGSASGQASWDV